MSGSKKTFRTQYLEAKQGGRKFILMKLPASVLGQISYAATRGQDEEEGAVQRVLNSSRISSIKQFTLNGGDYPNAIVLNWIAADNPLKKADGHLTFALNERSAQIIDGQHRVAGIRAAIEDRADLGKMELPVVCYVNLSTRECADIFLSINTEQKPVARSLVFDLYGVASEPIVDQATVRARDIAMFLNDEESSPYFGEIKLPGAKTRKGGIPLSSAVTSIKPLVDDLGAFDQIGLKELELQKAVIFNWLLVLREKYGDLWDSTTNVFMYAAGFSAAMDFLKLQLIPYCNLQQSFEVKTISKALNLQPDDLVLQEEVKGQGGTLALRLIHDRLLKAFVPSKAATKAKIKI